MMSNGLQRERPRGAKVAKTKYKSCLVSMMLTRNLATQSNREPRSMQFLTPALSIMNPLKISPYRKVSPAHIEYKEPHSTSVSPNSSTKNSMKIKSSEIKEKLSKSLHIRMIQSSFGALLNSLQTEKVSVMLPIESSNSQKEEEELE